MYALVLMCKRALCLHLKLHMTALLMGPNKINPKFVKFSQLGKQFCQGRKITVVFEIYGGQKIIKTIAIKREVSFDEENR